MLVQCMLLLILASIPNIKASAANYDSPKQPRRLALSPQMSQFAEANCSVNLLAACNILKYRWDYFDPDMPENEESLDKRCKKHGPFVDCLESAMAQCQGNDLHPLQEAFKSKIAMISKMCNKAEKSLRASLIKNSKCLNKNRVARQKLCSKIEGYELTNGLTPDMCWEFATSYQCNLKDIKDKCGYNAYDLQKEILDPITTLVDKLCSEFQVSLFKKMNDFLNQSLL